MSAVHLLRAANQSSKGVFHAVALGGKSVLHERGVAAAKARRRRDNRAYPARPF